VLSILEIDLQKLSIFQGLTVQQTARFVPLFIPCEFREGETIFKQGESAANLYMVVKGEVAVRYKPEDGPELTIVKVQSEGIVGWSAALGNPCYTSSVDCLTDCVLLKISSENLRELCARDTESGAMILERLAMVIAERLRNTHGHVLALLEQGLRIDPQTQSLTNKLEIGPG
jgi:CRP/FNR family transcriptional regulator, cyclic AMP receptor protein